MANCFKVTNKEGKTFTRCQSRNKKDELIIKDKGNKSVRVRNVTRDIANRSKPKQDNTMANFSSQTGEQIQIPAPDTTKKDLAVAFNPLRSPLMNVLNPLTLPFTAGRNISDLLSGKVFNNLREARAEQLERKEDLIFRKQQSKTNIELIKEGQKTERNLIDETFKTQRREDDLLAKTSRDLFSTNIFEKLLGNQTSSEKDLRDQVESNVALEFQSQLLTEQLRNAQSFIEGQSELLAVQQQAEQQGIELPLSSSTDKTFFQKYGVPIAIGAGLLIFATTRK